MRDFPLAESMTASIQDKDSNIGSGHSWIYPVFVDDVERIWPHIIRAKDMDSMLEARIDVSSIDIKDIPETYSGQI